MLSREQNWKIVQAQDLLEEIASAQTLINAIYELNFAEGMLSGGDIQYLLGLYQDLDIRGKVKAAGEFLEDAKGAKP